MLSLLQKKMQACGFFHNLELRPTQPFRNFNTWMGDPVRALQLDTTLNYIKDHDLIKNTKITGEYLLNGLYEIEKSHGDLISGVRGIGTYCAFDLPSTALRDQIISIIRNQGVLIYMCGIKSIRIRPMLVFQPKHAKILLETIDESVKILRKTISPQK